MEILHSKTYFETVAENWDKMASSFFGNAPKDKILSLIDQSGEVIVADLGCGSGYLTHALVQHGYTVYSIDQSIEMLKMVESKMRGSEKVTTVHSTSEHIQLDSESVDVVVFNMYLHHVERPPSALKEAFRILKKGGQLIFCDLDTHNYDFLVKEQFDRWMGFDRNELTGWLKDSGFSNIQIDGLGSQCCSSSCSCSSDSKDDAKIDIFYAYAEKK